MRTGSCTSVTPGTRPSAESLRTAPLSNYILAGVTRAIVIDLCLEAGIPVRQDALPESDLANVDEAFLTGSTTEVMPVVTVNGRPVGTGVPGPITRRLSERYLAKSRP